MNKSKKVDNINAHRDSISTKTNYPWQINFYFRKQTGVIRLIKLVNEHNHPCDVETIELAPKNLCLSKLILDKIEHYTINGRLGAGQQYDLLMNEFLQCHIKKKNLYNAINKFCGARIHDNSDAATLLLDLLKHRDEDPDYIVNPCLEGHLTNLQDSFG